MGECICMCSSCYHQQLGDCPKEGTDLLLQKPRLNRVESFPSFPSLQSVNPRLDDIRVRSSILTHPSRYLYLYRVVCLHALILG